jgi:hypothetical protein
VCFVITVSSFVLLHRRASPTIGTANGRYADSPSNAKQVLANRLGRGFELRPISTNDSARVVVDDLLVDRIHRRLGPAAYRGALLREARKKGFGVHAQWLRSILFARDGV